MRLLAQSRHSFMNLYDLFLRNYLIPEIAPYTFFYNFVTLVSERVAFVSFASASAY